MGFEPDEECSAIAVAYFPLTQKVVLSQRRVDCIAIFHSCDIRHRKGLLMPVLEGNDDRGRFVRSGFVLRSGTSTDAGGKNASSQNANQLRNAFHCVPPYPTRRILTIDANRGFVDVNSESDASFAGSGG